MALGFRVARWLEWNGVWNDRIRFLQTSKIRFCELWIAAGSIMSLSVGPWVAAACGAVIISVCRAHNRKRAIVSLALLIALFVGPIHTAFMNYISVDPLVAQAAGDQLRQDSAYRGLLIPLYLPVVEERPTWGWGISGFPVIDGMSSIDNGYLFVALTWGVYALVLLVALFVWPPIRLAIFSLPLSRNDPRALAAFSMIGIYVLNAVMEGTASGGGTPWRLLIIIAGWSAAVLKATTPEIAVDSVWSRPRTQFGFRRVMV